MSEQQPSNTALPKQRDPKNTTPKTRTPWFVLVVVLVIAALVFAQYRIEIVLRQQSALEQQLQSLTAQSQQQSIQTVAQKTVSEQGEKALASMQGQLAFMQHTLNQIPGARLEDWKLAETEYLLRLANQRVYLQNELKGAHGLFDAANQVLAHIDDPALLVVREQIAKEMLLLGQHNQIDRQGLYSDLQAIKALIRDSITPPNTFSVADDVAKNKTQPQSTSPLTNSPLPEPSDQTNSESQVQTSNVWQQILSLVSVRHRDDAFDAPLGRSQHQLLEHNINLLLEQAQWALLKADNTLYQSSLTSAHDWLSRYVRHHNATTLLEKINTLSAINVEQTRPDVSASLRLLRQVMQDRTYAPSEIKPIKPKGSEPSKPNPQPTAPASKALQKNQQEQA